MEAASPERPDVLARSTQTLSTQPLQPFELSLQMERLMEEAYEEVKVMLQRNRAALDT